MNGSVEEAPTIIAPPKAALEDGHLRCPFCPWTSKGIRMMKEYWAHLAEEHRERT